MSRYLKVESTSITVLYILKKEITDINILVAYVGRNAILAFQF